MRKILSEMAIDIAGVQLSVVDGTVPFEQQTPEGQAETRRNRIEQLQTEIEERQDLIAKLTTEMPTSASLQPAPE